MIRVGLLGVGRWGRNLLRVLDPRCDVAVCCNRSDPSAHAWLKVHYPHARCTFDYAEILGDSSIEAVVIATPIETHFNLAGQALEVGKHVFVEKPLATTMTDAQGLVDLADKRGLVLFVGHVFLYHPVLDRVKQLTWEDPVLYAKMLWTKFATFEEDVLWNLVSHEVSIALELFRGRPHQSTVLYERGIVTLRDIVTVRLKFDAGRECVLDVNRCVARKGKSVTIVTGAGEVLLWDNDALYKLGQENRLELLYESRDEPLAIEVDAFLRSVKLGEPPRSDGRLGLMVVAVVSELETVWSRGRTF